MIKQLQKLFSPEHYRLMLDINSEALTFEGTVQIDGTLAKDSSTISLHSKDLSVKEAAVDGTAIKHSIGEHDELILKSSRKLQAGQHTLKLTFRGKITEDMVGIYPCFFKDGKEDKHLIATQFESHYARQAFPCVDEPTAKATFDLELITNTGETVLSNMPIKKQEEVHSPQSIVASKAQTPRTKNYKLKTIFETTPRMSTYLLAFVCGELHCQETATKSGVTVRSWATTAQPASHLSYSLKEAADLIEFYNHYFQTPYPLKKLDQVALPDFDAGAMENWGLITYRETALLADPKNRSVSSEQYISLVIAHEISHQWFGNLVTMQWWDDLWLNESFASLMEYIAVNALHPEWEIWEEYTASDVISASNRDVYSGVQPVRVTVDDPAEISSLFDGAIVYAKGGRLLKMIREYVGEQAFQTALKQYFKTYAYRNTVRDDLWAELEAASQKPVTAMMHSWLEQSGLPILAVEQNGTSLKLSQKRLVLDQPPAKPQRWQIPLLTNSSLPIDILSKEQQIIQIKSKTPVLFNQNASGHYVVDYNSAGGRQQLRNAIKNQAISACGRINALSDIILLSKGGEETLVTGLELVSQCSSEPRSGVWSLMGTILGHARVLTESNEQAEAQLRRVAYHIAEQHYQTLGWEFAPDEDTNTTHLRRMVLGMMLSSEDEMVIQSALKQYRAEKPENLQAELRSLLMSASVRFGKSETIDTLLALHHKTQSPDLKGDICAALTSTKDINVAKRLTELLKDKEHIRPQDIIRWYAYLLRNKHTRNVMWQWTVQNWDWLLKTFQQSKSYDYLPRYAANFFNSATWLKEYQSFFQPMIQDPALTRTIRIGVKEIEARIAWRNRDEQPIIDWLKTT